MNNSPSTYIDPTGHALVLPHDNLPCMDGICSGTDSGSSSSSTSDPAGLPEIPGLPEPDGGQYDSVPNLKKAPQSSGLAVGFWNHPAISSYSTWEINILYQLYFNSGQEGLTSALYMLDNGIHIKVGKPVKVHIGTTGIYSTGDWQSNTHVAAWYKSNSVYLSPSHGYSDTQLPDIWGISLVAHEAKHIEQGGFPQAYTKQSEMEAWQLGIKIYQNLGATSLSRRDKEVLKSTSVYDFAYAIKHYDTTNYWTGLRLLPPYFRVP